MTKALKERPQLKLDVPIVFSGTLDGPQLAAARLKGELAARALESREGRKHPDTAVEVALAEPEKHFRLLVEQFHADLGKDTPLPPAAVAVEQSKRKETPPYDAAIAELNAALIDHLKVSDADLQALGKQRAQAIQDALLADGQLEAGAAVHRQRAAAGARRRQDQSRDGGEITSGAARAGDFAWRT